MTSYRVAIGHEQSLASMTILDPQPDPGPAIRAARRTYGGDGTVYDEGRFIELHFSALQDAEAYQDLLALFGLNANIGSADVTIYIRDEVFNWTRMNGNAIRPAIDSDVNWGDVQSRPLDIILLVRDLEELIEIDIMIEEDATAADSATISMP